MRQRRLSLLRAAWCGPCTRRRPFAPLRSKLFQPRQPLAVRQLGPRRRSAAAGAASPAPVAERRDRRLRGGWVRTVPAAVLVADRQRMDSSFRKLSVLQNLTIISVVARRWKARGDGAIPGPRGRGFQSRTLSAKVSDGGPSAGRARCEASTPIGLRGCSARSALGHRLAGCQRKSSDQWTAMHPSAVATDTCNCLDVLPE